MSPLSITGVPAQGLVVALALLAFVLVSAMVRPRGLPEAVIAVPAAGLTVLLGLVGSRDAVAEVRELAPTVGFLAAILVLAGLADADGVFRWLGDRLAVASVGHPSRLLGLVFVAASVTTAALSLDATVVLLTPVVLRTATALRARPRPHVFACAHLANSASTLLPVSNLTNLLAFAASGLTFGRFGALMALPWLAVIAVEYLVFRRFFATDLATRAEVGAPAPGPTPAFALAVSGLTLLGFGLSGVVGVEPAWVAVAGATVLAVRAVARREIGFGGLVRSADPLFCLFVLALGVVVAGVAEQGLRDVLAGLLPAAPTLVGLLGMAALAAVAANLLNNLPATLALLTALGPGAHPGLVLALLLGVNIGPNLSYPGSLATLLWRRVLAGRSDAPRIGEFTLLGALTVPACLLVGVAALWVGLRWFGPS